jgi:hypothetical protein
VRSNEDAATDQNLTVMAAAFCVTKFCLETRDGQLRATAALGNKTIELCIEHWTENIEHTHKHKCTPRRKQKISHRTYTALLTFMLHPLTTTTDDSTLLLLSLQRSTS